MDALTINEAAETTGWSPRMLRYVERVGLVEPARSTSGYRLYGPAELQRLRTLRELLEQHDIGLSDLAFALARRGRTVAVIASRQRYDAPMDILPSSELIDGVSVYRVWTTHFGRASLPGRAVDYATFYLAAAWRLWRLVQRGDVVIAETDPPMVSVIAGPLCRRRGARLVNWLQDIFPEVAQALGIGGRAARAPLRLLRRLRGRSLRTAHMNVVLGRRMAERVRALGVPGERIRIIPNWADGTGIAPVDPAANALRRKWQLGDAFVVGYSGNLGRAHEIDTFLEAMTLLEKTPPAICLTPIFRTPSSGATQTE